VDHRASLFVVEQGAHHGRVSSTAVLSGLTILEGPGLEVAAGAVADGRDGIAIAAAAIGEIWVM
jgi:hypothetical protein